ncbi:hypothetical protein I6H08_19565 [Burkholderia gladioli]|uniref:hypothetical protein n=1 Tax=Burkholderia gladioli TaxID=28095 RepID=UPI000FDBF4AF|nr:hypothetical protein [Burkholderia gladioli]QPQ83426.1 hypothetical protein I6H08_19565 [Burkholderia gladioli]
MHGDLSPSRGMRAALRVRFLNAPDRGGQARVNGAQYKNPTPSDSLQRLRSFLGIYPRRGWRRVHRQSTRFSAEFMSFHAIYPVNQRLYGHDQPAAAPVRAGGAWMPDRKPT